MNDTPETDVDIEAEWLEWLLDIAHAEALADAGLNRAGRGGAS